ncbi:hypothetical protein BU23DRAFT_557032 [Bimuria novae-zelandiae CBS 107.79]|uniref:Ribonucleases P/MRP subunit Pop8-like domain-containing protein n=1 Tax=Bimuria novae-zelandiae CBS 107.79 TaxID=1447943 RepID=A0A6A5UZT9_9PLEO|nr:hypothetical protein BU23DRAFT_557032 [Bimuria novae-zelandiae CBS 107.79]
MAPLSHFAPMQRPDASSSTTTLPAHTAAPPPLPPANKRKARDAHALHTSTFRKLPHTYFRLRLTTTDPPTPSTTSPRDLDPLTIRTLLTPALQSYLGLMGAAIPIDILKSEGRDVWVRVARQDARGVQASLSGWVGNCDGELVPGAGEEGGKRVRVAWRLMSKDGNLGLVLGDGSDLFDGEMTGGWT